MKKVWVVPVVQVMEIENTVGSLADGTQFQGS